MPVLLVTEDSLGTESLALVIVPRRVDSQWQWDEVGVVDSTIDGFGLATRESASLDWSAPPHTVYLPIIGRETELGSAIELDVFGRVLAGLFIEFPFSIIAEPPAGSTWRTNGVYVELVQEDGARSDPCWRPLAPDEVLLQVLLQSVTHRHEPDACVYLLRSAATRLLHIPPHVFKVLAAHRHFQHNDRHFASHVVSYSAARDVHMLVNAHPIFGDTAFAAGCVNEPPVTADHPSMEMVIARMRPRPASEQPDPTALAHWEAFTREFPEAKKRHIFFATSREGYAIGEELTASCAPNRPLARSACRRNRRRCSCGIIIPQGRRPRVRERSLLLFSLSLSLPVARMPPLHAHTHTHACILR